MANDFKPLKTAIGEEDARLIDFIRINNAGATGTDNRYVLIREWSWIHATSAKTLADALGDEAVNPQADTVEYTGTWDRVRVDVLPHNDPKDDNRATRIREWLFLDADEAPLTMKFKATCLLEISVWMWFDIPITLAQSIVDSIDATNTGTISPFNFNATITTPGPGHTFDYRISDGSFPGLVDLTVEDRYAIPYDSNDDYAQDASPELFSLLSLTRNDDVRIRLNQPSILAEPTDAEGIVWRNNPQKNRDCTWDEIWTRAIDVEYGPKTAIFGTIGQQTTVERTLNAYSFAEVDTGGVGRTVDISHSINQSGTVDFAKSTREVFEQSKTWSDGTVGFSNANTTATGATAIPNNYNQATTGETLNLDVSLQLDGTVNYREKISTAAQIGNNTSDNFATGSPTFTETTYPVINSPTLPTIGASATRGTLNDGSASWNQNGTVDFNRSVRVATPLQESWIDGTVGVKDTTDLKINQQTIVSPGQGGTGITNNSSASFNRDGSLNTTQTQRLAVQIGDNNLLNVVVGNLGETRTFWPVKNASALPSVGASSTKGETSGASASWNIDGTVDFQRTLTQQTAVSEQNIVTGAQGFTDTEDYFIGATTVPNPGAGTAGVTHDLSLSLQKDGSANYTNRVRQARELGPITRNLGTQLFPVEQIIGENKLIAALPNPGTGGVGVTTDLDARFNQDGTMSYRQTKVTSAFTGLETVTTGGVTYTDTLTKSENNLAITSPGTGTQGNITDYTWGWNRDGSVNTNETNRLSVEQTLSTDAAVTDPAGGVNLGTVSEVDVLTQFINERALQPQAAPTDGETKGLNFRWNQDGTFSGSHNTRTQSEQDSNVLTYTTRWGQGSILFVRGGSLAGLQTDLAALDVTTNNSVRATWLSNNLVNYDIHRMPYKNPTTSDEVVGTLGLTQQAYFKRWGNKWLGKVIVVEFYRTQNEATARKFANGGVVAIPASGDSIDGWDNNPAGGGGDTLPAGSYVHMSTDTETGYRTGVRREGENVYLATRVYRQA